MNTATLSPQLESIADNLGISLYQRFSEEEAAQCLAISLTALQQIRTERKISYLQITPSQIAYFGLHLVQYLLASVQAEQPAPVTLTSDRIVDAKELRTITSLSRQTIWRLENKGEFPQRVALGGNRVGWRLHEVNQWLASR